MTRETATKFPVGYFKLLAYAAMIGAVSALLTAGYLTALNGGIRFFEQPKLVVLNLNIWPLILLTVGGLILGLTIKFFGQHAGLGVAQLQYAETGRVEPKYVPRIMLQAFITLWSGAAVGPEGPLTFLSGGVGSFIADRLRLEKEDVPVLV
jgi:H+/Cl- antiporter ClcA